MEKIRSDRSSACACDLDMVNDRAELYELSFSLIRDSSS